MKKEILFNICKTVFRYLNKDNLRSTAKSILKIMDISVDFDHEFIEYSVDTENIVKVPLTLAEEQFPFNYNTTYLKLSYRDEHDIEVILNDNDDIASSFYPLLDCIGYVLIRNISGNWVLRWKIEK